MTDFHSLLKQSIIDRGISAAADRDAVYAQARSAVIRQLWAYQPALADEDIDHRIAAFDAAVDRIEAELVDTFADVESDGAPARYADEADITEDPASAAIEADDGETIGFRPDRDDEPGDPEADDATFYELAEEVDPDDGRRPYRRLAPGDRRQRSHPLSVAGLAPPEANYDLPPPEADYDPPPDDDDDDRRPSRPPRSDRWTGSVRAELPVRRWPRWTLGERDTVRILIGAIVAFTAILVSVGVYLALPAGDTGVTVPIGVRREVSDAATAARIAADALDVRETFVVFDGRDPTIFETAPDNPVRLDNDGESGFARVSSSADAAGVKVLIGPGLAVRLAGQSIRLTIIARSSIERGAAGMRFAYQSRFAISHWQTANLSPEYAAVGLIWRVPQQRANPVGDYILIEPGIPGDGTGADIRSIRIDLVAPS